MSALRNSSPQPVADPVLAVAWLDRAAQRRTSSATRVAAEVSAAGGERFELARMSGVIQVLTVGLLAVPLLLLLLAIATDWSLAAVATLMAGVYAWVWLRFRPTAFVVRPDVLEVIWPLGRRRVPRAAISDVQLINQQELRRRIGFAIRVGAGGLWGGFGTLWTQRRGVVRTYISRVDCVVWMELRDGPPWLITPDRPDAFVRAMRHTSN